jgi:hypothetical protein
MTPIAQKGMGKDSAFSFLFCAAIRGDPALGGLPVPNADLHHAPTGSAAVTNSPYLGPGT